LGAATLSDVPDPRMNELSPVLQVSWVESGPETLATEHMQIALLIVCIQQRSDYRRARDYQRTEGAVA